MKIEFELSEKQAQALAEVIQALGNNLTPDDYAKQSLVNLVIRNKQQMIANDLGVKNASS